jgi:serine phosphatase RsbU (regulator of sigma subunit)
MQAQIAAHARELQDVNRLLRANNALQREIALELQDAMLPVVEGDVASSRTAVRYRPAMGSLKVCGDWYDVADLGDDRIAMAVGDVVGHGLAAAGLMGQLRAALVAATRATGRPDRALDALDAYARSLEEAVGTTAVKVVVDLPERTLTYSVAGHPPPILLHGDGGVELLDQATGPPLAASPEAVPRPLGGAAFAPGDILVLYTDGLVERRGESLARGIDRLAGTVRRHAALGLEQAADAILAELSPEGDAADDVALVLVAL